MGNRNPFSALRWLSLIFILGGVVLFTLQLIRFSRLWANFPDGLSIAGIPVGQLNRQQAANRLLEAFSVPVELHYEDALIHLNPSVVGFELDLESMLAVADLERTRLPFWTAYWNYLWGSVSSTVDIPLSAPFSEERLRAFLVEEIAVRYDRQATPSMPVSGSVEFQPGLSGTALDIERSVLLVEAALRSPTQRVVSLPLQTTHPARPAFQNLDPLLKQTIDLAGFDGLAGLYLLDLQSAQEISFLYQAGVTLPGHGDVAFTGSNPIRIPLMVSAFRRIEAEPNPDLINFVSEMIKKTGNPPADILLEEVIDASRAPQMVTEDMRMLGLQNTFLAGYFYAGAPLLGQVKTPANQREDIDTNPDPYRQTTPADLGMLLGDIYQCAQNSGGSLLAVFPGEVTPEECELMIELLLEKQMAVLLTSGLPEGTKIAHKHGWVTDVQGMIHDMSDAAIVFTPAGNYVLVVFIYHPEQIEWETASALYTNLSRVVYNFYNLPK